MGPTDPPSPYPIVETCDVCGPRHVQVRNSETTVAVAAAACFKAGFLPPTAWAHAPPERRVGPASPPPGANGNPSRRLGRSPRRRSSSPPAQPSATNHARAPPSRLRSPRRATTQPPRPSAARKGGGGGGRRLTANGAPPACGCGRPRSRTRRRVAVPDAPSSRALSPHSEAIGGGLRRSRRLQRRGCRQEEPVVNSGTADLVDFNWETLGFQPVPTDFMYVMRCSEEGVFTKGELVPYGPIELNPAAGVLNYGQGLLEGLRAHRKEDGSVLLFRPDENALRMRVGADRLCMPAPSVEQFLEAIKLTILANKRWVPPTGKGSLYIRPLLIGSGAILGVAPAPEYTFVVFACPVGHYFKDGLSPISLLTEEEYQCAAPGGTGDIKTIGNYASAVYAKERAKERGHSDVLYLDPVHKKFVEELSSCNIFMVKDNIISTPLLTGTVLPGITRRSIIEYARSLGFQVEECLITIDELLDADEVFCTGTSVVLSSVGCIVYQGRRVEYGNQKFRTVSQQLYSALTAIQKGLVEDSMGWTVQLN
uniref:Branched-chain-amino-acid aminotransferase n=1 Tax=Oryza glumipatula TaxID=40148 RepID=A0A0D9ZP50_9ORYZ